MCLNVRRYDNSCHNKPSKGELMFQCRDCDVKSRYYICSQCIGNHSGHKIVKGQFNRKKDLICNCGELNQLIECDEHYQERNLGENCPLYSRRSMRRFRLIFKLSSPMATINLARINQLCSVELKTSATAHMIRTYFKRSNSHSFKMQIKRIWSVMRKDHEQIFVDKDFKKDRRMLLWHGTTIENLESILQNGFIKPDSTNSVESPASMFGPGIYFADRSSKSAQYTNKNEPGVLLLCEVALGSMWRDGHANQYKDAPGHFDSIKGVGKHIPDRNGVMEFDKDIIVPAGKTINNPNLSVSNTVLYHNEYIVFDPDRILIKFIVQIQLNK